MFSPGWVVDRHNAKMIARLCTCPTGQRASKVGEGNVSRPTGQLRSSWVRVGGLPVHARVSVDFSPTGSLPVVLVHGIGVASRFMVPIAEVLAPYHRIYAPDLPCFGESAKPAHILNLVELTDALADWMRVVGLESAAFLGNSFGCQIVVDLALRYSELVEQTVLQGPTIDPQARTAWQQIARLLRNSRHEPLSHGLISAREYSRCGFRRLATTFRYGLEDRIEEKLPRIRVPALVVRGSKDPIVPQRWAEEANRLLPMGRLAVIPGAPHTVVYDAPLDLARVVLPFLSSDQKGRASKA
jgi:2-hydroxy-6-oxonona-2,4-dienedioate hydrolase